MASWTTLAQHTGNYCCEKFEGGSEMNLSEYSSKAKADEEHVPQMQMISDSMLTNTTTKVFSGIGDWRRKSFTH